MLADFFYGIWNNILLTINGWLPASPEGSGLFGAMPSSVGTFIQNINYYFDASPWLAVLAIVAIAFAVLLQIKIFLFLYGLVPIIR